MLDNQRRLVLNDQSITLSHNEPQRSPEFVSSQNTIATNSSEFGPRETWIESKVNFFKHNFINVNAAIKFTYKLKNVSLTFQLTFLSNFWICVLFEFYFTTGKLGRYDVA